MKLHHVGIVIENKEILEFASEKTIRNKIIDNNQNNYIYFDYDNSKKIWFEYICPFNKNSTVFNFLKKKGGGLHHLGYFVDNIKRITKNYKKRKNYIFLSSYSINIPFFGGNVETSFFYNNTTIIEFISNEKK